MPLDVKKNFFELFSLPVQFSIDVQQLASNFRALQAEYHPDRFANASDAERRKAVQTMGYVNEANETLKSTRLRARYLLELKGVDFELCDTTHDMAFLMEQMERREALEESASNNDLDAMDDLAKQVKRDIKKLEMAFEAAVNVDKLDEAKEHALKMKFYERLSEEVKLHQEKLEDELFA